MLREPPKAVTTHAGFARYCLVVFLSRLVPGLGGPILLGFCLQMARRKVPVPEGATLVALALIANDGLASPGFLQAVVPATFMVCAALGTRDKFLRCCWHRTEVLFIGFLVAHAVLLSAVPSISILKTILWVGTYVSLRTAMATQTAEARQSSLQRIGLLLLAWSVGGAVTLLLGIAYLPGTSFYRGLAAHSQQAGIALSLAVAVNLIYGESFHRGWRFYGLVLVTILLTMLTRTRTAIISLLGGLAVYSMSVLTRSRVSGANVLTSMAFVMALIGVNGFIGFDELLSKGRGTTGVDLNALISSYEASRGALSEVSLASFQQSLGTGIGFGVPSDLSLLGAKFVFGVAVSLPIEKGNTYAAILEEIGLMGALAALVWWVGLSRSAVRNGSITVVVMLMLMGFGEHTLFSVGGVGLLQLVALVMACSPSHGAVTQSKERLSA